MERYKLDYTENTYDKLVVILHNLEVAFLIIGVSVIVIMLAAWVFNPRTDYLIKNDQSLLNSGFPIECNPLRDIKVRPEICKELKSYGY